MMKGAGAERGGPVASSTEVRESMVPCRDPLGGSTGVASFFVRLAPVLNVRDLKAERAFYERLGLPVTYEGDEYPDFIAFGTGDMEFGIQQSPDANDPPSVLTWQIMVSDVDAALERCHNAGLRCELEQNNPAPGWTYRRIILETPSGYRLALEGPNET